MEKLYQIYKQSSGVSIDTRQLKGGELFFCLRGDQFNGNKFAKQALEAGVLYVIVDDEEYYDENQAMLLVKDSLKCLQDLAKHHRSNLDIPVIGITGSNGKTTTKELISTVLSTQLHTLATAGNYNNHIGVPLTLLKIDESHQIAIIEMGANHPYEIAELCELSQPNYGVITNIGRAHLEGFGTFETIVETKMALYNYVEKQKGTVFVNADDELLMEKSTTIKRKSYSVEHESDFQLIVDHKNSKLSFSWKSRKADTQLVGYYNVYNAAAAIAVGFYFGISEENILNSLEKYIPSNNRSQLVEGKVNMLIMDAYNANPTSMSAAITHFANINAPQKALVLGDMLELGDFEVREHKAILEKIEKLSFKRAYLVGSAFYKYKEAYPSYYFFKDNIEAQRFMSKENLESYWILVKGSRGIRLEVLQNILANNEEI